MADPRPSDRPSAGSRSDHALRIGIKLRPEQYPIDVQRGFWLLAEAAGFDHVWSYDHLVAVGREVTAPIFEGWSLVAAMAATTQRIRMGLMVTGNLYRHPALLAKIATTIDHVSGGRLEFGLGAGWNEPEFRMFGLPFPSTRERISRLDEACQVLKALWTGEPASFEGEYYQVRDAIAEPTPVQTPHPPIWIGGSGPRFTLRVAARHADGWNPNGKTLEANLASSRLLDQHCEAIGRDPATLRRAVQLVWVGTDETCRLAEAYRTAGFSDIILVVHPDQLPADADPVAVGDQIAREALPRLRAMA
jgi:F420-dependent oxidoreductase-like protein